MSTESRLRDLAHPLAETMSDGSRLSAFVTAGIEAADELAILRAEVEQLKQQRHERANAHAAEVAELQSMLALRSQTAEDRLERRALDVIRGGAEMLRNAIVKRDPLSEIELRARDLLADLEGLAAGKARTIAAFKTGRYR